MDISFPVSDRAPMTIGQRQYVAPSHEHASEYAIYQRLLVSDEHHEYAKTPKVAPWWERTFGAANPARMLHLCEGCRLAVFPGDAKGGATRRQARGLRLRHAAGHHSDGVRVGIAADRDAVGGATGEANRAEVCQGQHTTAARRRFGDPLRGPQMSALQPLGDTMAPASRGIADGEDELPAARRLHLGAQVVAGADRVGQIHWELRVHLIPRVVCRRAIRTVGISAGLLDGGGGVAIDAHPKG